MKIYKFGEIKDINEDKLDTIFKTYIPLENKNGCELRLKASGSDDIIGTDFIVIYNNIIFLIDIEKKEKAFGRQLSRLAMEKIISPSFEISDKFYYSVCIPEIPQSKVELLNIKTSLMDIRRSLVNLNNDDLESTISGITESLGWIDYSLEEIDKCKNNNL